MLVATIKENGQRKLIVKEDGWLCKLIMLIANPTQLLPSLLPVRMEPCGDTEYVKLSMWK